MYIDPKYPCENTWSYQIERLEKLIKMAGSEIPIPSAADEGKVLTVDGEGKYSWVAVPYELPTAGIEDAGKVLAIAHDGQVIWEVLPEELPQTQQGDTGKVLTVGDSGIEWAEIPHGDYTNVIYTTTSPTFDSGYTCSHTAQQINELLRKNTVINYYLKYSNRYYALLEDGTQVAEGASPTGQLKFYGVLKSESNSAIYLLVNVTHAFLNNAISAQSHQLYIKYTQADYGKFLGLTDDGNLAWSAPLPAHTTADIGKILSVDNNNNINWAEALDPLPEITAGDEGKVLKVDQGEAKWLEDIKGVKYYEATYTSSNDTYTLAVSGSELLNAINNGYFIIVKSNVDNEIRFLIPIYYTSANITYISYYNINEVSVTEYKFYRSSITNVITFLSKNVNVRRPAVGSTDAYKFFMTNSNGLPSWVKYIPHPESSDNGKVLSVNSNGSYVLADVPKELPAATSADEGKVLTVNSSGTYELDNVPNELPAATTADSGKVLAIDASGNWAISDISSIIPSSTSRTW